MHSLTRNLSYAAAASLFWYQSALAQPFASLSSSSFANTLATRQQQDQQQQQQQSNSVNNGNTTCATSNGADPSTFSPALYTENARPQIHFSPSSGFMNDPNGLVRAGDTYHMYFQYNPNASVAGFQHWGHATSKDLYHWQNHEPAIAPANDDEGIFSGSAVLDVNNTSGFFDESTQAEDRFIAIYTLNTPTSQTQNIAYSSDGQNYTKFEGNPVISLNTTQFRDPKVFWDQSTSQWVMTVSHPQDYQVGFYGSKDLKQWTELSRFGPSGLLGYQYECPDLVEIPIEGGERDGQKAWVLIISINPGAPLGGSFVQTFIGNWDGKTFTPDDGSIQTPDFTKDFYASQTFYNAPDEKAIAMTWASNWQYTNVVPTSPWRSVMTVPRELIVRWIDMNPMHKGYQVTMRPFNLDSLSKKSLSDKNDSQADGGNRTISLNGKGAFEINATLVLPAANAQAANPRAEFRVGTSNEGEYLNVGVLFGDPAVVYVDRRFAGRTFGDNEPFFTDRFSQQFAPTKRSSSSSDQDQDTTDEVVQLQMIVDRTITEIFTQNGVAAGTVLHYWDNDALPSSLSITAAGDAVKVEELSIMAIDSTWPSCSSSSSSS